MADWSVPFGFAPVNVQLELINYNWTFPNTNPGINKNHNPIKTVSNIKPKRALKFICRPNHLKVYIYIYVCVCVCVCVCERERERFLWWNDYHRSKWSSLFALHMAVMPMGKVWIFFF